MTIGTTRPGVPGAPAPASRPLPRIIQGGMGVGVSDWRLANAVARLGELGVVSGTAIDAVLVRRLQLGDPDGHMRRAMARFPIPGVASAILERFFRPEGLAPGQPFAAISLPTQRMSLAREQITVV
ncbi:MAG TPA: hypothetical protein VFP65_12225, partial [Anaeromyxobacteraceae bacterium]|nr:hypothetical protein [Anaeromyxobacteraceae bacterium]